MVAAPTSVRRSAAEIEVSRVSAAVRSPWRKASSPQQQSMPTRLHAVYAPRLDPITAMRSPGRNVAANQR
jgi:hypothetical protein